MSKQKDENAELVEDRLELTESDKASERVDSDEDNLGDVRSGEVALLGFETSNLSPYTEALKNEVLELDYIETDENGLIQDLLDRAVGYQTIFVHPIAAHFVDGQEGAKAAISLRCLVCTDDLSEDYEIEGSSILEGGKPVYIYPVYTMEKDSIVLGAYLSNENIISMERLMQDGMQEVASLLIAPNDNGVIEFREDLIDILRQNYVSTGMFS